MQEQAAATPRPVRVLLVDDHPLMRMGLRDVITGQADLVVCGEASSVSEAEAAVAETQPDLAIVDITLRGGSGLELVRTLRGGRVRVLVSSMHDDRLYAERALAAGAHGYINKSEGPDRLIAAIRAVLAGRVYLTVPCVESAAERVSAPLEGESGLSNRELQIFELLGRGKTIREIAGLLAVSPKTVETHRQNIKSKLGVSSSPELTARAATWLTAQR